MAGVSWYSSPGTSYGYPDGRGCEHGIYSCGPPCGILVGLGGLAWPVFRLLDAGHSFGDSSLDSIKSPVAIFSITALAIALLCQTCLLHPSWRRRTYTQINDSNLELGNND